MTTTSAEQNVASVSEQRVPSAWGYYLYCEFLKLLRNPPVVVFGVLFPTFFFALFGSTFSAKYAPAVLASYAGYAAFVVPFSSLSNTLAAERGLGWNKLLRTTPLSVTLYLAAKIFTVMVTGIVSMLILFAFARLTGRVSLDLATWAQLLGVMTIGMLPFVAMGMFLGLIASATAAQAISTVVFLVLSFTSGLFVPIQYLPSFVAQIAPALPTYHLGQLAWNTVGSLSDNNPLWQHFLWLACYLVAFLFLAVWAYRRDESRSFS